MISADRKHAGTTRIFAAQELRPAACDCCKKENFVAHGNLMFASENSQILGLAFGLAVCSGLYCFFAPQLAARTETGHVQPKQKQEREYKSSKVTSKEWNLPTPRKNQPLHSNSAETQNSNQVTRLM